MKRPGKILLFSVLFIMAVIFFPGCQAYTDGKPDAYDYNEMAFRFNDYCRKGLYDSLEIVSRRIFSERDSYSDRRLAMVSGLNAAQAAIFKEEYDTAKMFLDSVMLLDSEHVPLDIKAMLSGIWAVYEMKVDFNYPGAIRHLTDAVDCYRKEGNVLNVCTGLCNISMIYYFRRDTSGTEYARQAYEMSLAHPDDPYMGCVSRVMLSMMLLLKNDIEAASDFAAEGLRIAKENGYSLVYSRAYMVLGVCAFRKGDPGLAETLFKKGFEYSVHSDPDFYFEIAVPYGSMMIDTGRYEEAEAFLKEVLDSARYYNNVRYIYRVLGLLSHLYDSEGNVNESYRYFRLYHSSKDSLLNLDKEINFNSLLRMYEKSSLEAIIREKQSKLYVIVSIAVLTVLVGIFIYYRYRRQSRSYHELVERHQRFLQRTEMIRKQFDMCRQGTQEARSDDEELFRRLDDLMREQKIYRNNDLSLEKTASMLGSNRTYVSRVINRYVGKSFYGYVNMYRIDEATKILADEDSDMPLKNICEMVGYNSLTAFYRVFIKEVGCPPSKYREEVRKIRKEGE